MTDGMWRPVIVVDVLLIDFTSGLSGMERLISVVLVINSSL